jgi:hypothetical protein
MISVTIKDGKKLEAASDELEVYPLVPHMTWRDLGYQKPAP